MRNSYPIHERFLTWQGEGVHMGRRAFFIRTMGCPVKCPFCDSAGTWHPDWVPADRETMTVEQLVRDVLESRATMVVITGGEPTIFDLTLLTAVLKEHHIKVHLETSGGFQILGTFDWVTVSPKRWGDLILPATMMANEFKLIIQKPEDIQFYLGKIVASAPSTWECKVPIWLHPEWSQRDNPQVLEAISRAVTHNPKWDLRAGYQLHKLYKVDSLDYRSRPLVPLGGVVTSNET